MTNNLAQRVKTQGTPLIDGNTATFVWLGEQAPALAGDFTDWERGEPVPLKRTAKGVWSYQLELPADAYIEYAFVNGKERIPDPFNPRTTPNGIGDTNHFFYMPQGAPTPLARRRRGIPRGTVTFHTLHAEGLVSGGKRRIALYRPPVDRPVPLVVVWDGKDFQRRARLPVIVDNLIARQRIQPIALALAQNGGPARSLEYGCSETTLRFLLHALLPLAHSQLNLLDPAQHPGAFGVLGASMGGLMAMFTALRLPHIFGKALCQSGAYEFWGYDTQIFDLARLANPHAVKLWLDVGLYDFRSLIDANRRMHTLLVERGFTFEYRQYPAGHNYPAWRDELWRGLEYLYPPTPSFQAPLHEM